MAISASVPVEEYKHWYRIPDVCVIGAALSLGTRPRPNSRVTRGHLNRGANWRQECIWQIKALSSRREVWQSRITLPLLLLAITSWAQQPPPSTAHSGNSEPTSLRDARKRLAGRTDSAAIKEWRRILDEMHLASDPELKSTVQSLRAFKLYDNESWVYLVNMGYAYTGDSQTASEFRAELARERPDSSWAIQAAIQQWEATHRPESTSEVGFGKWSMSRLEFLERLHEQKPHSTAATSEYAKEALALETRLSSEQALNLADLVLSADLVPYDPRFDVTRIYLDHHVRLDDVPRLLKEAVENEQNLFRRQMASGEENENINQRVIGTQLRAHLVLAEYWGQKNDIDQARLAAQQAKTELMRLGSADHTRPQDQTLLDAYQTSWLKVAKLVGIETGTVLPVRQIDWSKVERTPLDNFEVADLNGRRWSLQAWRGKVVLVNMWATWCTPCRAELPYIQKLYDALKGRPDRLVISIDVDSDEELARRLVHERGYTFPVLSSRSLANQIDFVSGVPQNRIVDTECRLLAEPVEGIGDVWVSNLIALMDRIR